MTKEVAVSVQFDEQTEYIAVRSRASRGQSLDWAPQSQGFSAPFPESGSTAEDFR